MAVAPAAASPNFAHMQDRLAELLRQRALVAEHLAWLDREIATEATATAAPAVAAAANAAAAPQTAVPPAPPAPVVIAALSTQAASEAAPTPPQAAEPHASLLPEHRPTDIKQDVKRGCFLYMAIATLLIVALGALLVWASQQYKKTHPAKPSVEQPSDY